MSFARFVSQVTNPAPGYQQALAGFGGYRGPPEMLSAPFYPMAFNVASQYLSNLGGDPFGNAVRQAASGAPLSRAEQMRQQWQEQQEVDAEQKRQTDAWWARHRASMPPTQSLVAGMTPDNKNLWSLLYSM